MIKLALSGDMHVNVPRREEEAQRIAYWMGEDWKARGVHFIGIAGDLVDGPMTERQRAGLIDLIIFYSNIAPVVLIDGNHEIALALRNAVGRFQIARSKSPDAKYPGAHPIIVEDGAGVHVVDTAAGPLAVACLSFPKKAQLLAAAGGAVSTEEADDLAGRALQDVCRSLGARVRELGLPTVALIHATIRGSKISADDQPDRPLGLDIPLIDVGMIGAHFYCVGHIHKAQHWTLQSGAVVATPSCPFFSDYGEAKHEKGYILAEFNQHRDVYPVAEGDNLTERDGPPYWSVAWRRVPTPATPMLLIDAEWRELAAGGYALDYPRNGSMKGCDVRLRYRFAGDQRKAATAAAEDLQKLFDADGAVKVTLDPVLIPTTRARIPELAATPRLEDKWLLYVKSIDLELSDKRRGRLLDYLREFQEQARAAGVALETVGRSAPLLKNVRLRGFMKYPNEVSIDFTKLEGNLTAIVAPNEMGKTVLMQIIGPGLLYGTTPSRGSLDDLSIAKDSFVEGVFDLDGAEHALTQNVNGKERKGTISLLKKTPAGPVPLLDKAGRDEYKTGWMRTNLLPDLVYNTIICHSGSPSIIDMGDGPRVDVLTRVLGLDFYEALAKMARDRADEVNRALQDVRARIDEVGKVDVGSVTALRDVAQSALDVAERAHNDATGDLEFARQAEKKAHQQLAEYNELVRRRDALEEQKKELDTTITGLKARIEEQKALLSQEDAIREAEAELKLQASLLSQKLDLDRDLQTKEAEAITSHRVAYTKHNAAVLDQNRLSGQLEQKQRRLTDLDGNIDQLQATLDDAETIRQAVTDTASFNESLKTKEAEASQLQIRMAEQNGLLAEAKARQSGNAQQQSLAQRQIRQSEVILVDSDTIRKACDRQREVESAHAVAEKQKAEQWEQLEETRSQVSGFSSTRITGLRDGLQVIADGKASAPDEHARSVLEEDDKVVSSHVTKVEETTSLAADVARSEAAIRQLEHENRSLLRLTSRSAEIETAKQTLETSKSELSSLRSEQEKLALEINSINETLSQCGADDSQVKSDIRWLNEQIEQLVPLVARSPTLGLARVQMDALKERRSILVIEIEDTRSAISAASQIVQTTEVEQEGHASQVSTLSAQRTALQKETNALREKLEELQAITAKASLLAEARIRLEHLEDDLGSALQRHDDVMEPLGNLNDKLAEMTPPEVVDVQPYEQALETARVTLEERRFTLRQRESALSEEQQRAARLTELMAQRHQLEEVYADFKLLGDHLGKDHLQKAEINCAGPQLTALTNDLLRAGGDTRHTVSIETERLHSNKKQMVPCLNINVFDSVEGITKESRRLSDAGKVLVGKPYALALVELACQRVGITGLTIFLDEATGPCDEENGPRYIAMIRRFAEVLKARILFVAQQSVIHDLADSKIKINNGVVTVL